MGSDGRQAGENIFHGDRWGIEGNCLKIMIDEGLLVSVVIPAYNQGVYLVEAVESVLAQTYRNFEIIIVDDGSTDNTREVAHSFGDRVRYIWQENQGLAGARNTGIRHARGRFIALLDSDDRWLPGFLKNMVNLAQEHPEGDVYYSGWLAMDEKGKPLPQRSDGLVVPPQEMYLRVLRGNFLNCCSLLLRRGSLLQAGLFDPSFRRLQDWELWLRMLRDGFTFLGTTERMVLYRMHSESLSTDPAGGQQAAVLIAKKLFGEDDGHQGDWSETKRLMYGGVYRYHALSSLMRQGDWQSAGRYLKKALQADPSLADDLSLFYELAVGAQPMGHRGRLTELDFRENASRMVEMLSATLQPPVPGKVQEKAWASAYQALGTAAYNAGKLRLARQYIGHSLSHRSPRAASPKVLVLWLKTFAGSANLSKLRRLRKRFSLRSG